MNNINVIVAGATGYIGLELVKLLIKHPKIKIRYLCAHTSVGKKLSHFDSFFNKYKNLPKISKFNKTKLNNINVLFTALPNGEAQKISKVLSNKTKLIDLSADFRLENSNLYKKWYKKKHKAKHLIKKSIYSIPELIKENIKKYKIIACPGCYPTSIQIPLIPLIKNKMIKTQNIIIDSKSGYSGAGKNLHKRFKFKNLYSSVSAYGVSFHRHVSEIEQEFKKNTKKKINFTFIPHLSPMFRGILSTIYIDLTKNNSAQSLYIYLKKYYKKNLFIKISKFNSPIGTGNIMNTNNCCISICKNKDKKKAIILCAIDNLIKGGSGQAVQNFNLIYNFNENLGFK